MENKFKVGDRVRVKDYKDIKKTLDYSGHAGDTYFPDEFKEYCGKHFVVSAYNSKYSTKNTYKLKGLEEQNVFVEQWLEKIANDKLIFKDNTTILFKDGKKYVAKCCDGDTYDREKGLLVCLAKAHGYTFNDLQEMLESAGEPKGKVREVEREAKVGEYIKIVRKIFTFDKVGDILKVDGLFDDDIVYVYGKNHKRATGDNNYKWAYDKDEYVVLENYKPNKFPQDVSKEIILKALGNLGRHNGLGFTTEDEVREFYNLIKGKFEIREFDEDFSCGTKFFDGRHCTWGNRFCCNYKYKNLKREILKLLGEKNF